MATSKRDYKARNAAGICSQCPKLVGTRSKWKCDDCAEEHRKWMLMKRKGTTKFSLTRCSECCAEMSVMKDSKTYVCGMCKKSATAWDKARNKARSTINAVMRTGSPAYGEAHNVVAGILKGAGYESCDEVFNDVFPCHEDWTEFRRSGKIQAIAEFTSIVAALTGGAVR